MVLHAVNLVTTLLGLNEFMTCLSTTTYSAGHDGGSLRSVDEEVCVCVCVRVCACVCVSHLIMYVCAWLCVSSHAYVCMCVYFQCTYVCV